MAQSVLMRSRMNTTWRVFGPVRSRRLGVSLGIDPLPFKRCSYDCVYCQLGHTRARSVSRKATLDWQHLLAELRQHLDAAGSDGLDWITVVGGGEPTLYADLGSLLHGIRALTPVRLAVITNGSLLHRADVRAELLVADAVMPSLDAGEEDTFRAINRPHPDLSLDQILEGLVAFRSEFSGRLWVEVMLVAGLNDDPAALDALEAALARIDPDEVHINVPTRPPAESWVHAPAAETVRRAMVQLAATPPKTLAPGRTSTMPRWTRVDLLENILSIVGRHPMTASELAQTLDVRDVGVVEAWLKALRRGRFIQPVARFDRVFWTTIMALHDGSRPPTRRRRSR